MTTTHRTEGRTPRTDALKLHPDTMQHARFEGCDSVIIAPEDHAALHDHARALETELNEALEQNEALRGALDELLAWADTMRVAYEHPFLNDTAIHNARKALLAPPTKA